MDVRLFKRALCELLSRHNHCVLVGSAVSRRHESTFRRTKKKLNVKPDSSFLLSKQSPQDHIIFNPPSSAPSVLHTPLIFLPKDDKRRLLLANSSASATSSTLPLPPPVVKQNPGWQRHHVSEADVAEMRRLHASDPEQWTKYRLAKKFKCNVNFVVQCCPSEKEWAEAAKSKIEAEMARWGPRRRMAREDREKRREAMYRDE